MAYSSSNTHFSSRSPRISNSRHPSNSDEQDIISHILTSPPCDHFHPYLSASDNAQNISVQFMHSCTGQDSTQLDSDILQRRLHIDNESPSMAVHPIVYPESSQRTTSHALLPYDSDASRFTSYSPCDLATLHIVDAPLHGPQPCRRSSWPSHPQVGYSPLTHSPPRILRSPASEPPESTSDESYQDSDLEEATLSPMLNQFQIQSRNIDLATNHINRAQSLQPSVMTFQLSDTMLQLVDDPENRHMMSSLLGTSIVGGDPANVIYPSPSSSLPTSSPIFFGGTTLQGPSMRFQHDRDKVTRTNQLRMPTSSFVNASYNPANSHASDNTSRLTGPKQKKKSKMHQCQICRKEFPRPSGLATHLNTHSGARPYKCIVENCQKSFAVRSNAKRHLRTHGLNPASPGLLSMSSYAVGFEEPVVTHVHDAGRQPTRYRWIPQIQSPHEGEWPAEGSLSSAIAGSSAPSLTFQASMSSTTSTILSTGSDDECDEVATCGVADVRQYQGDYNKSTDEFSRDHPSYGQHS